MSKMGKLRIFIYSLFFSIFVFSCSNSQTSIIVTKTDDSLRNKMSYLNNNILWTENLDNILQKDESASEDDFENSEEFKNLLLHEQQEYLRKREEEKENRKPKLPKGLHEVDYQDRLFYPKNEPPVESLYPEFQNFGSLDISLLAPEIKSLIQKFIDGINQNKLEIDCISPETRFLEPIFLEDFALIEEITSFIIGKPVIIQNEFINEYQVPIRLVTENGFYNSLFFLVNMQDSFFIEQVNYGSLMSE